MIAGTKKFDEAYEEVRAAKLAAQSDEAKLARLRESASDLAEMVTEGRMSLSEAEAAARQGEEDRLGGIRRIQERLRALVGGWIALTGLESNPERDDVLAGLMEVDRGAVLKLEAAWQFARQKGGFDA